MKSWVRSTYTQYKTPYYRAKVHLEMPEVVPACMVTKMHGTTTFCVLLGSHTQQGITSPPQLGSGEAPTAAASGCLSRCQWMAKIWPESWKAYTYCYINKMLSELQL